MPLYQSDLPLPLLSRGKVRDIYRLPETGTLLMVATDRLSAFDVVFEDPIPRKGEVLNQMSAWWFAQTKRIIPNHLITATPSIPNAPEEYDLRCSLCRPAKPFPVECVIRGYLEGSAWTDYQATQEVSGIRLPQGLARRAKLQVPIFTPSTKAESGHDMPIDFYKVVDLIGVEAAEFVRRKSLELYQFAHQLLLEKGIVISDTKFEFGVTDDGITLIDEIFTPDSSRFWEVEAYSSGGEARSLDKQYVRDYVSNSDWDKKPPAPRLPADIIENTTNRYLEIFSRITGYQLDELKAVNQ